MGLKQSMFGVVAAAALGVAPAAMASQSSPTVVELFTSQGCSSCPPANANLVTLSQRPDVLVLSFAVTYWDYLGWKDTFDKPEFTARQVSYEAPLHQSGPYTPQMVVNGAGTVVGNDLGEVVSLIEGSKSLGGPAISIGSGSVSIGAGAAPRDFADVWLVRYDPNIVEVPVARGENSGRTLPHTHVVHDLERLGQWNGTPISFDVTADNTALRTAILVQAVNGGPILSASTSH